MPIIRGNNKMKSVKDEIIDAQVELGVRELIIKSLFGRKHYNKLKTCRPQFS